MFEFGPHQNTIQTFAGELFELLAIQAGLELSIYSPSVQKYLSVQLSVY